MGTTAERGYPYPESTDPPQGDAQIQTLAEAIDVDVAGLPILQAGKSIIPAEQSRTDTAYGYLGTEDKVSGVVVDDDDIIVVRYLALWKCSIAAAGRAAIFIGANQLSRVDGSGAPAVQEVAVAVSQDTRYGTLASAGEGLIVPSAIVADESFVTTGLALANHQAGGGQCHILKVAAGTYDVGVQFKATSGSVSAKERNLFVEVHKHA